MTSVHPEHAGQRFSGPAFTEMVETASVRMGVAPWCRRSRCRLLARARTTVTFTLEPSERGTRLTVSDTRLRRDFARASREGLRRQQSGLARSSRVAAATCRKGGLNGVSPALHWLFAALGDTTRLVLLQRLSDRGPASISMLAEHGPGITRQGITRRLHVLSAAGVIDGSRKGREHVWTLNPKQLAAARRRST